MNNRIDMYVFKTNKKYERWLLLRYCERKIQFFNTEVNIYDSWKGTLNTYGKGVSLLLCEKLI